MNEKMLIQQDSYKMHPKKKYGNIYEQMGTLHPSHRFIKKGGKLAQLIEIMHYGLVHLYTDSSVHAKGCLDL
jgi:hypothetical protein